MKLIKEIIRGAGHLEDCGDNVGNFMVVVFILIGAIAGLSNRNFGDWWVGMIFGACVMAVWAVPLWVAGCIRRAREQAFIDACRNRSRGEK